MYTEDQSEKLNRHLKTKIHINILLQTRALYFRLYGNTIKQIYLLYEEEKYISCVGDKKNCSLKLKSSVKVCRVVVICRKMLKFKVP